MCVSVSVRECVSVGLSLSLSLSLCVCVCGCVCGCVCAALGCNARQHLALIFLRFVNLSLPPSPSSPPLLAPPPRPAPPPLSGSYYLSAGLSSLSSLVSFSLTWFFF